MVQCTTAYLPKTWFFPATQHFKVTFKFATMNCKLSPMNKYTMNLLYKMLINGTVHHSVSAKTSYFPATQHFRVTFKSA